MSDDGFSVRTGGYDAQSAREDADGVLLQEVGAMLRSADPVPPHVRDNARALLTWGTVDDAMARLLSGAGPPARPAPTN
jgi:hypothetical protein